MRPVKPTPCSKRNLHIASQLSLLVAALALSGTSSALEYELSLELGGEYSDNIDRLNDELKRDEVSTTVGAIVSLTQESQNVDVNLDYVLEQSEYKNDRIETETQVQGATEIDWRIYEDVFSWDFSHLITEANLNDSVASTPDTRETRNVFSTGPTIAARLSKVDRLILSGDYTIVEQDTANVLRTGTDADNARNLDSNRTSAQISWQRALSATTSLAISYSQAVTELDDDSPDFEFAQIFASYQVELASGRYGIALGYNEAERDNFGEKQDGNYAAATYFNEFDGRTLAIDIVNQLTDSSIGLGATGADVTNSNFNVVDIVERTNVRIAYGYPGVCASCDWELSYEFDKEDFQEQEAETVEFVQDSEQHILRTTLRYRMNSRSTAKAGLGYIHNKFEEEGRDDDIYNLAAGIEYTVNDTIKVDAGVEYDTRDTSRDDETIDIDYDELSGYVTLTARLL